MDFKEYKKAYTKQALALGVSLDAIGVAMEYAEANDDFVISDVALGEALPYLVWVEKGDPKGILEDINATIKAANDEGLMDEWIAKADELSAQALEG